MARPVRVLPVPRRALAWVGGVIVILLAVGLTAVASFPTGAATPADLVGRSGRLAASAAVGDVEVLLSVDGGELVAIVAYPSAKDWLGVDLEAVPGGTAAAWAATSGGGSVPALSAVYGRAPGAHVVVHWSDGERSRIATERDGAYVVARAGVHTVERAVILDDTGGVVLEVTEL